MGPAGSGTPTARTLRRGAEGGLVGIDCKQGVELFPLAHRFSVLADHPGTALELLEALAAYARCVDGQLPDLKRRLEAAGDLSELPGTG
ncbi:hypothetical protein AB0A69_32105 [Streptomyces sp. NPDC045431]|uniref:hypothetical protein n=1 Tax=Streptomyces sp. NPDC045431 TaxID=3155613 RepID=UPI0033EA492A